MNLSLVGFSASESPLIITDSFIEVSLNYSDVENSKDNLIVRAKYNGEDIELDLSQRPFLLTHLMAIYLDQKAYMSK